MRRAIILIFCLMIAGAGAIAEAGGGGVFLIPDLYIQKRLKEYREGLRALIRKYKQECEADFGPLPPPDEDKEFLKKLKEFEAEYALLMRKFSLLNVYSRYGYDPFNWQTIEKLSNEYGVAVAICSSASLSACPDQSSCTAAGGYWYNNRCNSQPEGGWCSSSNLSACKDRSSCESAGGVWTGSRCEPPPQCSPTNLSACTDQSSCERAGGVWTGGRCEPPPQCSAANLSACTDPTSCQNAGGYWYNNQCNAQPECSSNNLSGCQDQTSCQSAGGYWYNNQCNAQPECSSSNLSGCQDQTSCQSAGGYWYNNQCNAQPECRADNLGACTDQSSCRGAGGYWYGGQCHADCSGFSAPNRISASVAGSTAYLYYIRNYNSFDLSFTPRSDPNYDLVIYFNVYNPGNCNGYALSPVQTGSNWSFSGSHETCEVWGGNPSDINNYYNISIQDSVSGCTVSWPVPKYSGGIWVDSFNVLHIGCGFWGSCPVHASP